MLQHLTGVIVVRYDKYLLSGCQLQKTLKGLPEQGFSGAHHIVKLLWPGCPAGRPESATYTASHYGYINVVSHIVEYIFSNTFITCTTMVSHRRLYG